MQDLGDFMAFLLLASVGVYGRLNQFIAILVMVPIGLPLMAVVALWHQYQRLKPKEERLEAAEENG